MAERQKGTKPVPTGIQAISPEPTKLVTARTVGLPPEQKEHVDLNRTIAVRPKAVEHTR